MSKKEKKEFISPILLGLTPTTETEEGSGDAPIKPQASFDPEED